MKIEGCPIESARASSGDLEPALSDALIRKSNTAATELQLNGQVIFSFSAQIRIDMNQLPLSSDGGTGIKVVGSKG
jgi:hypothetical protein